MFATRGIGLAAVASAPTYIRLGAVITPLSRRRPWKVARRHPLGRLGPQELDQDRVIVSMAA